MTSFRWMVFGAMGAFCATAATAQASACDPLMVDLSGDGIFLSSPAAGVYFDLHGFVAKTAWPTTNDDGFLAVDVNGDGHISGSELFGGSWVKSPGGDGFGSLAPYDIAGGTDGGPDGSITAADPIYASLLVWFDLNRDGVSQAGELFTLVALGITSLSIIADMDHPTSDQWGSADLGSSATSGKARIHAMIPAQADTGGGHTNATDCDGGNGGGGGNTPPPPDPTATCPWYCEQTIYVARDPGGEGSCPTPAAANHCYMVHDGWRGGVTVVDDFQRQSDSTQSGAQSRVSVHMGEGNPWWPAFSATSRPCWVSDRMGHGEHDSGFDGQLVKSRCFQSCTPPPTCPSPAVSIVGPAF